MIQESYRLIAPKKSLAKLQDAAPIRVAARAPEGTVSAVSPKRRTNRLLKKASEGLVLPILPPNPPHFVRGEPAGGGRNSEGNASGTEAGPFSATCQVSAQRDWP